MNYGASKGLWRACLCQCGLQLSTATFYAISWSDSAVARINQCHQNTARPSFEDFY